MAGTIPIPDSRDTTKTEGLERPGGLIVLIVGAAALMAFVALWIAMILIALRILH